MFRVSRLLGLVAILALWAGCSDTPYPIVPIHGKVTYEDGSVIPAKIILMSFYPQVDPLKPNVHPRPGLAKLNPAYGSFDVVSTCEHGDGVIVGKHKVTVKVSDESPTGIGSIPAIYANLATTPLEIEVTGANQEFQLKIERPGRAAKQK